MPFPRRDAQTRIKHSIVREYAGAFVSIIGGAFRRFVGEGKAPVVKFAYVDGFAGYGRYERDTDGSHSPEPIWGSPIIAMRAFERASRPIRDAGVSVELSAVVVEEDPLKFAELIENIAAASLTTPYRVCEGISDALYGQINLICADFRNVVPDLIAWLDRHYTLALIDPFGTGMPMEALGPLLSRDRTDAIVLFPYMDVARKGASVRKPREARTPGDNGNVTRVAAVFGNPAWEEIAKNTSLSVQEQEAAYEDLYYQCLESLDTELVVKNIPLRLSSAERTVYHLFLTTRDPDGALRMNSILRAAGLREHFALWGDYFERRRQAEASRGEMDLFGGALDIAPEVQQQEIDRNELKRVILTRCPSGTVITVKELRRRFANDLYLEGEINSALAVLKREGQVEYNSLRKVADIIKFL
jgi:three-Cys-motif partner protein